MKQGGVTIMRMPYPLSGREYKAIVMETRTGSGFSRYTYDLDSGLLLCLQVANRGGAVLTPNPDGTAGRGRRYDDHHYDFHGHAATEAAVVERWIAGICQARPSDQLRRHVFHRYSRRSAFSATIRPVAGFVRCRRGMDSGEDDHAPSRSRRTDAGTRFRSGDGFGDQSAKLDQSPFGCPIAAGQVVDEDHRHASFAPRLAACKTMPPC